MMVVVTYDVNTQTASGRRRLRLVAKECVKYGQRVQDSVFECMIDASQYCELKHQLSKLIDPQHDSLRFYRLGNHYSTRIEHLGREPVLASRDVLMI